MKTPKIDNKHQRNTHTHAEHKERKKNIRSPIPPLGKHQNNRRKQALANTHHHKKNNRCNHGIKIRIHRYLQLPLSTTPSTTPLSKASNMNKRTTSSSQK